MEKQYKLSILIPSAYPLKLARLIDNLKQTMADFDNTEIVICLDGDKPTERTGNFVYTFSPPSKYRSTFFEACWKASTGRFVMMANDDILMMTPGWDAMIPFDDYPDDLVLFYFKDNWFDKNFSCHPVWSRKIMGFAEGILAPLFQITKCDNTIWEIHPAKRRIYIPEIELKHIQTPYGPEWANAYREDNIEFVKHQQFRIDIRNKVCRELNLVNKVLIGVPTAEYARRADFYDHFNQIQRPEGSLCIFIHGQSVAFGRNQMIRTALQHDCSHVFFLDDDVIAKPDIIFQLLKHDKDIVCALQLSRNFPHRPYIFDTEHPGGKYGFYTFNPEDSGLIEIKASGFGAILIKTEVFKHMLDPWLRFGQIEKDQLGEDLEFFTRAHKAGYRAYCDLDTSVGHITSAIVWPNRNDKDWFVSYDTNGTDTINFVHTVQNKTEKVKV